ncbi:hypothetical protein EDD70_2335 [Hydrogenoanaerobacterium saccharovorans]|uniref:Uncharacterized protein n=1 Tax=Hydrogenoanaerobacterium saccharovorans TaxID=474960 RepID=A0A1H8CXL4_9FIRM|nr:hypothetical protein [Hydrogenoanaerobacterium saccharovorans]RPF43371.1 hypothetical protein EDD70_2335 [Hydrogenoanaerobacterium saccharovorans]SEM99745.1 hypothetical protein SAMN05216180_2393 [Hydrogenoanaerobacterium saccharovorans]
MGIDTKNTILLIVFVIVAAIVLTAVGYGIVWLVIRYFTYDSRKLKAQQQMLEQSLIKFKEPASNSQYTKIQDKDTYAIQQLTQRVYKLEQEIKSLKCKI